MVKIETEDQTEYIKILNECHLKKTLCFVTDYEFILSPKFLDLVWNCKIVIFKNCHFFGHVYFTNTYLGGGVQFENCTFRYGLTFDNCTSGEHQSFLSDGSPFSISFSDCEVNNRLIVKDCELKHKILVHRNSKIPMVEFENTLLTGIDIIDSNVLGEVEISGFSLSALFYIRSTTFSKNVFFSKCNGGFDIAQSTFKKGLSISHCEFGNLDFKEITCQGAVNLEYNRANIELSLRDSIFEKPMSITVGQKLGTWQSYIEKLILSECDFKGGFTLSGQKNQTQIATGKLLINCSNRLKGNLNFLDTYIGDTEIFGMNDQSILMAFCHVKILNLSGFINKGALSLVSIYPIDNPLSHFKISKSVIGRTFISDCDLTRFSNITITHSNLTELTSSSVIWFRENQLNKIQSPSNAVESILKREHHGRKELYRQLKFAMERQGDQVSRLEFKKRELKCYRLELKQFGPFHKVSDQMILWLNQSNDYGFNWLKPSWLLLLSTLVTYIIMAIGINPKISWAFDLDNFWPTVKYLRHGLYNYFTLLNPAHRITDLFLETDKSAFVFWFYFIDFTSRLIVSYLLFQTITAFRKYIS